jgi:hypothetical protein
MAAFASGARAECDIVPMFVYCCFDVLKVRQMADRASAGRWTQLEGFENLVRNCWTSARDFRSCCVLLYRREGGGEVAGGLSRACRTDSSCPWHQRERREIW